MFAAPRHWNGSDRHGVLTGRLFAVRGSNVWWDKKRSFEADGRRRGRGGLIMNSLFASRTFSGDRALLALQRQLAFRPDQAPHPPLEETSNLSATAIKLSVAVGLAALSATVLIWLPGARQNANEAKQSGDLLLPIAKSVRAVEMQSATVVAPPSIPTPEAAFHDTPNPKRETATTAANPLSGPASAWRMELATVTSGAASDMTPLQLANDEIAMLLRRGKDFFKYGDLVSARLLFRRAAAAGNAEAAFLLGRTFDPVIAGRMGIIGIKPDIASARQWYEKAAELGSPAASLELIRLQRCS